MERRSYKSILLVLVACVVGTMFGSTVAFANGVGVVTEDFSDPAVFGTTWKVNGTNNNGIGIPTTGSLAYQLSSPDADVTAGTEIYAPSLMVYGSYTCSFDLTKYYNSGTGYYVQWPEYYFFFNVKDSTNKSWIKFKRYETGTTLNSKPTITWQRQTAGQTRTIKLVQYDDCNQTPLTYGTLHVDLKYEAGGYLTLDCTNTATGVKTRVMDRVYDNVNETWTGNPQQGYFGVLFGRHTGGGIDNIVINNNSSFIVMDKRMYNDANQLITSVDSQKGKTVNVDTYIKNNLTSGSMDGEIIIALKNSTGDTLYSVARAPFSIASLSAAGYYRIPLDIPSTVPNGCKIEGYYWNGLNTMQPLEGKQFFN